MNRVANSLYDQAGGFDVILALTRRWHELCLSDPLAGHPFDRLIHPHHDVRLAAYLSEALGGPQLYTAGYGDETSVQRLHACNGLHLELDEACLGLFDQAVADVGIAEPAATRLSAYFRSATEAQRVWSAEGAQVPDGLPFRYEKTTP
jgi:hemoglobin